MPHLPVPASAGCVGHPRLGMGPCGVAVQLDHADWPGFVEADERSYAAEVDAVRRHNTAFRDWLLSPAGRLEVSAIQPPPAGVSTPPSSCGATAPTPFRRLDRPGTLFGTRSLGGAWCAAGGWPTLVGRHPGAPGWRSRLVGDRHAPKDRAAPRAQINRPPGGRTESWGAMRTLRKVLLKSTFLVKRQPV